MANGNSVVWVVQQMKRMVNGTLEPVHDISDALKYGDLRIVLPHNARPWEPDVAAGVIRETLAEYEPGADHLLLMGTALFIGMVMTRAVADARDAGYSHVRVLHWNRHRQYESIAVPIDALI